MSALNQDLQRAISHGLDFILGRQAAEGCWIDWALPPGPSLEWTTGYVGFRLSAMRGPFADQLQMPVQNAAEWLSSRQFADGGWGYNRHVQSDADSTSLAVLLLSAAKQAVPPSAYAHLLQFQRKNGGFSTFLPDFGTGSWASSHPEITPIALLALSTSDTKPDDRVVRAGLDCMWHDRRANGFWPSFWWSSPLVATEINFVLLSSVECSAEVPATLQTSALRDNLEASLQLSVLLHGRPATSMELIRRLTLQLVYAQQNDGSWLSAPSLRITQRDCDEPWDLADPGALFADPQRLHTTATVINALSNAYSVLQKRRG